MTRIRRSLHELFSCSGMSLWDRDSGVDSVVQGHKLRAGRVLEQRGYLELQIGRCMLYDSAAGRLRAGLLPRHGPMLGFLGRPGRALHVRGHGRPWQARVRGGLRGPRLHTREQICNCPMHLVSALLT